MNRTDAEIVARFIVGWWPGLEDGLSWPNDAEHPEGNPIYAAAKRILSVEKEKKDPIRAGLA